MVASGEDDQASHPFWYARVLGVFHARVAATSHSDAAQKSLQVNKYLEFLWVRWLGMEPSHSCGFKHARLSKVGDADTSGMDRNPLSNEEGSDSSDDSDEDQGSGDSSSEESDDSSDCL